VTAEPNLPDLALRPLVPGDLKRWLALQAHIADPYDRQALEQEFKLSQSRILGYVSRGHLLGALLAWLVVDELQIMQVVVAAEARRGGIGRALVLQSLRRSRAAGAITATLEVRASNDAAIALYAAMGFQVDGRRPSYYPDGEDAVLMHHDLRATV